VAVLSHGRVHDAVRTVGEPVAVREHVLTVPEEVEPGCPAGGGDRAAGPGGGDPAWVRSTRRLRSWGSRGGGCTCYCVAGARGEG
jgi:hypothetical protein